MLGLNTPVQRFDRATGIPDDVRVVLRSNPARANIILSHAEKVFDHPEVIPNIDSTAQLWLVYSKSGTSDIQFILSCTEGPLGKYPIFIVPTAPIAELTPELLETPMEALCNALLTEPGFRRQRVFSVFSVKPVTEAFAGAWERLAEIKPMEESYYDAVFMMCSRDTLVRAGPPPREDVVIELRLAVEQDADTIASMCEEFAATSVCLPLHHPFK